MEKWMYDIVLAYNSTIPIFSKIWDLSLWNWSILFHVEVYKLMLKSLTLLNTFAQLPAVNLEICRSVLHEQVDIVIHCFHVFLKTLSLKTLCIYQYCDIEMIFFPCKKRCIKTSNVFLWYETCNIVLQSVFFFSWT